MKNPWMSAYLSCANSVTGADRGNMAAEIARTQHQMVEAWTDAWMGMFTPWTVGEKHRRRR